MKITIDDNATGMLNQPRSATGSARYSGESRDYNSKMLSYHCINLSLVDLSIVPVTFYNDILNECVSTSERYK